MKSNSIKSDHFNKSWFTLLAVTAWLLATGADAAPMALGNPIRPGVGLTDPHVSIYGDRAYLYGTHDFSPDSTNFVTKDWWVWSSTNLLNWEHVGTLKPEDTCLKRPSNQCWAGFGATRNNKYYWYLSIGPAEIGVVTSDSPVGPWRDPLGKPLVPKGFTPTEQRDPDILTDDDGQSYLIYGTFKFFIARLNGDMISFAEAPRRVHFDREFGPYGEGKLDDKPSLHKRKGIYYLSWCSFYAISTNLYGPYAYKGSVITAENVAPEFQVDKAARGYDLWHDRHGNFFTWHNQWFYIFNDKSQPGTHTHFRNSCLAYVHYRDNGEIAPIRLDRIGVGQYDAAQSRIEAEDFFASENAEVRENPDGGFEVRRLRAGSRLLYPSIQHLPRNATITFSLAAAGTKAGVIEVRDHSPTGRILGTCSIPDTRGWDKYQPVSCRLQNQEGQAHLCLTFKGKADELLRLDWFHWLPQ